MKRKISEAEKRLREELMGLGDISPRTVENYIWVLRKFARYVDKTPTVADARRFLGSLREQGVSKAYVHVAYYALRSLFKILGKEEEFTRNISHKVPRSSRIGKPTLTVDQIERMVSWAKSKKGKRGPKIRFYLALSTTFGLRRTEMSKVQKGDISEGTITIWTAKGGEPRVHLIPDEIAPYVYGYTPPKAISESGLTRMFWEIAKGAKLKLEPKFGWHSIRRGLSTELARVGVNPLIVNRFIRWKTGFSVFSTQDMYIQLSDSEVDRIVFENHPFLHLWREL